MQAGVTSVSRSLPLIILGFVLGASAVAQGPRSSVDDVLRRDVTAGKVPGVVAMVVNADGVVYQGSFGARNETAATPMSVDTIFRIASMTKPVTAVAVMQLVEVGKVKLDEPASTYLPEIGKAQVLDHFDAETGEAVLRPPKSPVTVRELLSNTSGYAYDRWDDVLHKYRTKVLASGEQPADFKEPLLFDPGTKWEYGTSTTWLGRLVEAVSGQSLEEYFRQHILEPLGMADTSFIVDPAKQSRLVTLHQREDDGQLKEVPPRSMVPPKFYDGGGGLSSTAGDYAVFLRMILNGGHLGTVRILEPASIAMMEKNQIGALTLHPFKTTNPKQSIDGMVPGGLDKFGLGFAVTSKAVHGRRSAGSIAWAGLDNTYFWIDPSNRMAAVIMMQVLPFLDAGPISVLNDFEGAVYEGSVNH